MDIIPSKLANLLHGLTDDISGAVGNTLMSVGPILERNESPFFPDYTDHGIDHIRSVLRTCELIIGDDSWFVFTREDAAVLVLATLAHDLGMLVNVEGFRYLVDPSQNDNSLIGPNDEPWYKLWREFQLTARRFDGPMLIRLLGSPEPVAIEELDPANFTERGLRIVGEFLRRHHHRLAHEIVIYGMPSENGIIPLFSAMPQHLRDMAGLIARSHGVPVRECLEPLIKHDRTAHREYRHIHPTFLMTLVRIADYLDLDIGRAPTSVLAAKSLKSPISRREWWAHRAIVDCHSFVDDPECLHVVVEPEALPDIETFTVVEDKIIGIQQELDSCWAVLGEVYGRFPPLNRLSLKIRRIRSDLRESSIIHQLPFVPHKASLKSSRADLLKLLIEPLYGNHPGIGIRELVQNSIDAVRELDFTLIKSPSLNPVDREELEGDVEIYFEKDSHDDHWVIIKDRGIGMTWATVCNYYLTAGASFRQSDAWRKRFTANSGESQVLRSGRFGIGILAAFLLGDRIQVSTRHIDELEERGIFFEFGLDDTIIEMKWLTRKVGTTIKVRTDETTMKKFMDTWPRRDERWDWFCLRKPVIVRRDINGKKLKQKYKLPEADGKLSVHMHQIQVPGYETIHWTYLNSQPELVCNGILISNYFANMGFGEQFKHDGENITLKSPKVSVFDPDGRLPLNLARDRVASSPIDLVSAITDDLCRNYIAFCLSRGPQTRLLSARQLSTYSGPKYPVSSPHYNYRKFGAFFDTTDGFGISDPWNISHFSSAIGLLIRAPDRSFQISRSLTDLIHETYGIMFGVIADETLTEFDRWHRKLVLYDQDSECLPAFLNLKKGLKTLMPIKWYERFISKQPKFIINLTKVQMRTDDWVIWSCGDCLNSDDVLISLAKFLQESRVPFESVTECYFSPNTETPEPGRIAQMWRQVIGEPIIPFDKVKRQRIVDSLDEKFERHLAEWAQSDS